MIQFLLNNRLVETNLVASTTILDFIRYEENLRGTKIGCREGDCGACTILIGSFLDGKLEYMSATSCLTPLPNVHGKHVVTVEGLNLPNQLNQAQKVMVEFSGTQCGFCTPGFVNSLCGYAMNCTSPTQEGAISAIDGNICRCTGYKSIERAAGRLSEQLLQKDASRPLSWLVDNAFIPEYFLGIEERLKALQSAVYDSHGATAIGGGTDLYVQKHDDMHDMDLSYLFDRKDLNGISFNGNYCTIKSSVTVSDLIQNQTLLDAIPNWYNFLKLVSSTPIRNIGTIAGNLANGSPIGDFTIILLALKAEITLVNNQNRSRQLPLKDFYLGYKTLDKTAEEIITAITFELPRASKFHFEKVSKRQYLDIASVNTAINIRVENNKIMEAHCAMGGVGPVPKYLAKTCEFLLGKIMETSMLISAQEVLQGELSPISDARGTEEYKRLLARQLFFAHFITLFPENIKMQDLI